MSNNSSQKKTDDKGSEFQSEKQPAHLQTKKEPSLRDIFLPCQCIKLSIQTSKQCFLIGHFSKNGLFLRTDTVKKVTFKLGNFFNKANCQSYQQF